MPRRRRTSDYLPFPFPFWVEITLFAASIGVSIGFTCIEVSLAIDKRIDPLRQAFGLEVDLGPLVPQLLPFLIIAGSFVGIRFHAKARKWLARKFALA